MNGEPTRAPARYGTLTIALHWFMLLLLAAVYAAIELRELFPRGSDARDAIKALHYMLGLSVLLFLVVRLNARLTGPRPPIVPPPPRWQSLLAGLTHGALYLFMLAMPIAGWIIVSAEGEAITFFGLPVPPLVGENEALAKQVEGIHRLIGTIGYVVIALHAAAGLIHHYWLRDSTLRRMLLRSRR